MDPDGFTVRPTKVSDQEEVVEEQPPMWPTEGNTAIDLPVGTVESVTESYDAQSVKNSGTAPADSAPPVIESSSAEEAQTEAPRVAPPVESNPPAAIDTASIQQPALELPAPTDLGNSKISPAHINLPSHEEHSASKEPPATDPSASTNIPHISESFGTSSSSGSINPSPTIVGEHSAVADSSPTSTGSQADSLVPGNTDPQTQYSAPAVTPVESSSGDARPKLEPEPQKRPGLSVPSEDDGISPVIKLESAVSLSGSEDSPATTKQQEEVGYGSSTQPVRKLLTSPSMDQVLEPAVPPLQPLAETQLKVEQPHTTRQEEPAPTAQPGLELEPAPSVQTGSQLESPGGVQVEPTASTLPHQATEVVIAPPPTTSEPVPEPTKPPADPEDLPTFEEWKKKKEEEDALRSQGTSIAPCGRQHRSVHHT